MAEAMGNRERYHCMISTCNWYYERSSLPTGAELERAIMFGPAEASGDRAMRTNAILRDHFEMAHTLEEWVVEIGRERRRADKAERQLAEIGETREEFGVRTYNNDEDVEVMSGQEQARELAEAWRREIPGSSPTVMVRIRQSKPGEWREASE